MLREILFMRWNGIQASLGSLRGASIGIPATLNSANDDLPAKGTTTEAAIFDAEVTKAGRRSWDGTRHGSFRRFLLFSGLLNKNLDS